MYLFYRKDSVWGGTGPSTIYQSNHLSTQQQQQQRFETVTSGKKKKKQKMVRADPSLLGESKYSSTFLFLLIKTGNGCFSSHANRVFFRTQSYFRVFCERVVWEVEYGRNRDFGGLLKGLQPSASHWLYPVWAAAVLPKPPFWFSFTVPSSFTWFQFPMNI